MRTAVGLLVAAVLVLGGCSGESSPGPDDRTPIVSTSDPTATESSQPTPRITMPTVEAPDDSPMYSEFSEEAALEFLDYFWNVLSYLRATKDVKQWDQIADSECMFCADIKANVLEVPGYVVGMDISLLNLDVVEVDEGQQLVVVSITTVESSADYFDSDGHFVRQTEADGEPLEALVYLRHMSGQWKFMELV